MSYLNGSSDHSYHFNVSDCRGRDHELTRQVGATSPYPFELDKKSHPVNYVDHEWYD